MPVARLDDRAVVRIAGPDAGAFLQNVLTLDIAGVDARGSGYGALLTPQGKILWDFVLHRTEDGYAADLRADQADSFAKRLGLYKLRAKVAIAPAAEVAVFAAWDEGDQSGGPNSRPLRGGGEERPDDPRLAALGRRWLASPGSVAVSAGTEDWHAHRIALAVPEGGVDFVFGDAFPHDAAMDSLNGVAFDKGCYIGQEVVSRMRHRGTARRRILSVEGVEALPEIGTEIVAGERALGRLGSSAARRGIALARLDRVRAARDDGLVPCAGSAPIALELPGWATYGWPAAAGGGED